MEIIPKLNHIDLRYWAITLVDSELLLWSHEGLVKSTFIFNWKAIGVTASSSYTNLSIAVAKHSPSQSNEFIANLAHSIYYFSRLKETDVIFAFNEDLLVTRIGKIISIINENLEDEILVSLEWFYLSGEVIDIRPFLKTNRSIQKLSTSDLLKVLKKFNFLKIDRDRPEIIKRDAFMFENKNSVISKYLNVVSKKETDGRILLFYGTNRNIDDKTNVNKYYGNDLDKLKYGTCEVSIPPDHVQGEIERPKNMWFIQFHEKDDKHIVVKKIIEYEETNFFSLLSEDLKEFKDKSALIFIHGYNVTFAEAARRTAQITWDIPFKGISGFFSWPSDGKDLAYFKDIEHADATVAIFEEFIEKVVNNLGIEKLHLIAHSMGNRLLTFTLNNLSEKPSFVNKLNIIQQIVLAAPDIDQNVFKNIILPKFKGIGARRTLYSSELDKALHLSEEIRMGLPRLGDAGQSLFVANGLDTIDASNIKSKGANHSYIFDTKELLADLYYLLNNGFDPVNRRLQGKIKDDLPYWLFPM